MRNYWHQVGDKSTLRAWFFDITPDDWVGLVFCPDTKTGEWWTRHIWERSEIENVETLEEAQAVALMLARMS